MSAEVAGLRRRATLEFSIRDTTPFGRNEVNVRCPRILSTPSICHVLLQPYGTPCPQS